MPRPSPIPDKLQLEATIRPGTRAQMTTEEGRVVPVKLFCTERKVVEFKIIGHTDDYVTVEGGGYRYRIVWSNAEDGWNVGQPAPRKVRLPGWVNVGRALRYTGEGPLSLMSVGSDPVVIRRDALTGRFQVVDIFARHLHISMDGIAGQFRLDLDESFENNWRHAADSHDGRIKPATFLAVGRRIMPVDVDGNFVGTTSFIIEAHDPSAVPGGTMTIAPLLGEGIIGATITLPAWNSAECWAVAPDDSSKVQIEAGMTVRHDDLEYEVLEVNPITKQLVVVPKSRERHMFRIGDPWFRSSTVRDRILLLTDFRGSPRTDAGT